MAFINNVLTHLPSLRRISKTSVSFYSLPLPPVRGLLIPTSTLDTTFPPFSQSTTSLTHPTQPSLLPLLLSGPYLRLPRSWSSVPEIPFPKSTGLRGLRPRNPSSSRLDLIPQFLSHTGTVPVPLWTLSPGPGVTHLTSLGGSRRLSIPKGSRTTMVVTGMLSESRGLEEGNRKIRVFVLYGVRPDRSGGNIFLGP